MSTGAAALQSTFTGHVATTHDALVLFEACLTGQLSHVPRRPHDRERNSLIRSGCIFIYEENASGIKRWTDGVTWSPSRILGNFLVYRELDKPFPPGEKKRAMKKTNRRPARPGEPYPRPDHESYSPTTPTLAGFNADRAPTEVERHLIGSLIDSYGFKPDGLVKKTMSVTVQGVTHHLVSYYNVNDVVTGHLRTPTQTENLQYVRPRPELTSKQSFRSPLEEMDDGIDGPHDSTQAYGFRPLGAPSYGQPPNPYYLPGAYPPPSQHHGSAGGYPVGIPALSNGNNYLSAPVPNPHGPQRHEEYGHFGHAPYNRSYESLSNGATSHPASVPPTPASAQPTHLSDRGPSHHSSVYSQSNMQPRPIPNPNPVSMDARPGPYGKGSFSMPITTQSPRDPRRSTQASPVQINERRDSQHTQVPIFPIGRPPYFVGSGGAPNSQPHYQPGPPPLSSWTGPVVAP